MAQISAWERSFPLQEKAIENLPQQIRNVSEGRTADGRAGDLRRLSLPNRLMEEAEPAFRRLFRNLAYYSASELSDSTRTALIWKGLALARRYGDGEFACCTGILMAAWFLAGHPRYITGKAGMCAILKDSFRARLRHRKRVKAQKIAALAIGLREATKPPPRPVLWHEGEYRLESLIHPFHLWEEGIARRNCLSRIVLKLSDNHPANTITPETLYAIAYWRIVKNKKAEIYSFFKGSARRGLVMLSRTKVLDLESTGSKDDREMLIRAVCEIRASRGLGQFNRDGRKR